MIELLRPWAFLLLPLPLLAWHVLRPLRAPAAVHVPIGIRDLLQRMTARHLHDSRRSRLALAVRTVGWLALIVALAGPFTRGVELSRPTGRDLIVALDLSSSMGESDMSLDGQEVARYQVVRRLIGDFLAARRGDRAALIAFGHEAFLIAPLTFDTRAVAQTLDELVIGLSGHRTDLGRAVGLAIRALRDEPSGSRVLVILSDGEDNTGALTGLDASRMAALNDLKIYTIGFSANLDGDGVAILSEIAETTGGTFYRADTAQALAQVAQIIAAAEPITSDPDAAFVIRDWTPLPLAVALFFLVGVAVHHSRE